MTKLAFDITHSCVDVSKVPPVRFFLFGFVEDLALHLGRSPSIHSNGYGSSNDRPTCLANSPKNSESFVQYAGSPIFRRRDRKFGNRHLMLSTIG